MAYSLSFSDSFFSGSHLPDEEIEPSRQPTSVYQAILSLSREERASIAHDVFAVAADDLDPDEIMRWVEETDTCTNLVPPVEVWIDRDGAHTLLVY